MCISGSFKPKEEFQNQNRTSESKVSHDGLNSQSISRGEREMILSANEQ